MATKQRSKTFPTERPPQLRPRSSTAVNDPKIPDAGEILLRIQQKSLVKQLDPVSTYGLYQISLTVDQYLKCVANFPASYGDITDLLENLLRLHAIFLEKYPWVSSEFAYHLAKFLSIVDQFNVVLDTEHTVEHLDWAQIARKLINEEETRKRVWLSPEKYVPSLKEFGITKLLGAGGFGTVLETVHRPSKILCCMKLVPKIRNGEVMEPLYIEKMIAALCNHPLLIRYLACFVVKDAFVTLMEYGEHLDVHYMVEMCRSLLDHQVRLIIYQVVLALEHMHIRGFLHRDLKPSNMLITETGHVKLIDFDIGRTVLGHHLRNRVVSPYLRITAQEHVGQVAGTYHYVAPEVLDGVEYGRASDWWSVGICVYKMIMGNVPFKSTVGSWSHHNLTNPRDILFNHIVYSEPSWTEGQVESGTRKFIEALLIKNPVDRLGSKSPDDIRNHAYFRAMMGKKIWERPAIIEDKLFQNAFRRRYCTFPRLKNLDVQQADGDKAAKSDPCSYISPGFRRLKDHLETHETLPPKDNCKVCDKVIDRTPASYGIENYQQLGTKKMWKNIFKKSQDSPQWTLVINKKTLQPTLSDITVPRIIKRRDNSGSYLNYGFHIQDQQDEEGNNHVVIIHVSEDVFGRPDIKFGDIIRAVNDVPVTNINDAIPEMERQAREVCINLLRTNPFRLLRSPYGAGHWLFGVAPRDQVILERSRESNATKIVDAFGFETERIPVWDGEQYLKLHVIRFISGRARFGASQMFIGDAIIKAGQLGKQALSQLPLEKIEELEDDDDSLLLEIVPLSLFRRNRFALESLSEQIIRTECTERLKTLHREDV